MKKLFTLLCLVLLVPAAWAKQVPQQDAQQFAVQFYKLNNASGIINPQIKSVTVKSVDNTPTLYIFRFTSGGFVLVAADDASIPIPGYSFENDMPQNIDHPAVKEWLDSYSRQIAYIVSHKIDNKETLKQWNAAQNGRPMAPSMDVLPLTTTLWDQGCFYNTLCPVDAAGPCSHVQTGCVATCMAQIMRYHNFPPQGFGQHTYSDPTYGQQTANFGNTTYDWSSMPNTVTSNNTSVENLMYQAGVSVDMLYSPVASGAYAESVPVAFREYFNYSPEIDIKYLADYTNVNDFKALLRADLDAQLPICYSGYGPGGGHEFVCDGYRMSDGTFHFNWGWSGSANGYFAIGNLNPNTYTFNEDNAAVIHIKPYNPNLIVRITHPMDKTVVGAGASVDIKASVVRGSATMMKIFIDSVEKCSTSADSIQFTWNTTTSDLGPHVIQAYAYNSTDTVYNKINLNVTEWVTEASAFPVTPRAVSYLSAVDSNIVWGIASLGNDIWNGACSDFTKTINGGATWTPGVITNTTGLKSAMIFALNANKAYVPMVKITGSNPMGIYMTLNGGATWTRQTTAFNNAASFPDVVHFFNNNEGVAIGDPINSEYEIYTTTNGGTNWIPVAGANIPNPIAGEWAIVGYYSAVHDTTWFGTNKGRIYKSADKGHNWTVSVVTPLNGKDLNPAFRNGSHGLVLDETWGTQGVLCETFDGGTTWTQVNFTGPNYGGDIKYVPGTPNTWVKSGYFGTNLGCAYSFDGGHSWSEFSGTNGAFYCKQAWVNNHCGWVGGMNTSATEGGVYKYIGLLQAPLPVPLNVQATAILHNVDLSWNVPVFDPVQMTLQGYNITRNGTKINASLITGLNYTDQNVTSGHYTYCVSAQYNVGSSQGTCQTVDVAVGMAHPGDQPLLEIYPNPAHGRVMVKSTGQNKEILISDQAGNAMQVAVKPVSSSLTTIDISSLSAGIYLVSVKSSEGVSRSKLVVY